MVLKKKFSYQFKLFLPITCLLWAVIIGFSIIQHNREVTFKTEYIKGRIDILNSRIVDLLDKGKDPSDFVEFVDNYFDHSVLDNLSLTIYDTPTGVIISQVGFEAPRPEVLKKSDGANSANGSAPKFQGEYVNYNDTEQAFYYNLKTTDDGRYLVQTLMPYDDKLMTEISRSNVWWWFMVVAGIIVTIITFLTTRHLTNNIKLLRKFATSVANDADFVTVDKFSNDDLGEISRMIVSIYATRQAAIIGREIEHKVALEANEDRNRMRTQLTNNINHELKTPATIIKGYIDTLMDNPDMDEESRNHFMTKAQNQIERLCSILNDLSTMTRLEEASQKVRLEEIDFSNFISEIENDIQESHLIGDMKFHNDIPENCKIKGNATLLNATLMNLIKNAVAYSHGTDMGIKVMSKNSKFYTFIFWDNGTGVDEEHLPLLFDRFYRVDKGRSRKAGGTGLGLSIARSSINTMGGTISVRNATEGGLEFIISIGRWNPKSSTPKPAPTT